MSGSSVPISDIWMWPVVAMKEGKSALVPAAIAVGIMYYYVGGSFQGQETMTLVQGYLAGGAGYYAYEVAMDDGYTSMAKTSAARK